MSAFTAIKLYNQEEKQIVTYYPEAFMPTARFDKAVVKQVVDCLAHLCSEASGSVYAAHLADVRFVRVGNSRLVSLDEVRDYVADVAHNCLKEKAVFDGFFKSVSPKHPFSGAGITAKPFIPA